MKNNIKTLSVILHLLGWAVIFGLPVYLMSEKDDFSRLIRPLVFTFPLFFIYFLNYLYLIPNYLFKEKRNVFYIANIMAIVICVSLLVVVRSSDVMEVVRHRGMEHKFPMRSVWGLAIRDVISFIIVIGFVTALRLMGRFSENESILKKAENMRVKAELANLQSQINPHFLLNTLNNIYALVVFKSDDAPDAVMKLSKLLRYVISGDQGDKVLLIKEVEFFNNYIELMRIRLHSKVKLEVDFNVDATSSTQ